MQLRMNYYLNSVKTNIRNIPLQTFIGIKVFSARTLSVSGNRFTWKRRTLFPSRSSPMTQEWTEDLFGVFTRNTALLETVKLGVNYTCTLIKYCKIIAFSPNIVITNPEEPARQIQEFKDTPCYCVS